MNGKIVIFWIGTLAATFGVFAALYPYAAVPQEVLTTAHAPQPMDRIPDINLGDPYGTVSVADLVGYYIEHPPVAKDAASSAGSDSGRHFGGC